MIDLKVTINKKVKTNFICQNHGGQGEWLTALSYGKLFFKKTSIPKQTPVSF